MILFSILIPTLQERQAQFQQLYAKLWAQIQAANLGDTVEILQMCDARQLSLGTKRNRLIREARGEFVAFVDDDDDVASNYVQMICNTLQQNPGVDCLGITGLVYFRGTHPHRFVYSRQYDHYFTRAGVYYRPPYILNPVRRAIAAQYLFEEISFNEDIDWAMRLARAQVLQHEVMLDESLYHYYSRRRYTTQWLIDVTEPLRRPLGLELANRLRLKRWLKTMRAVETTAREKSFRKDDPENL